MYYLIANRMLIDKSKAGSPVAENTNKYLEIKPININIYTTMKGDMETQSQPIVW